MSPVTLPPTSWPAFKVHLRMWRKECSKEKARLGYEHPEDFLICFWQKKPRVSLIWVLYRALVVLYLSTAGITIIILRDVEESPWYKNPIFFYYWVYCIEVFAFVLALAIVVERYWQQKKHPELPPMEKMPWHFKLFWLSYTIAASCATVVTFVFCLFVYSVGIYPYLSYAIVTHVSNTVTIVIDFSVGAVPFRFLHIYLPLLFSIVYGLFSFTYQKCGGSGNQGKIPIYKMLDWKDPATAIKICTVHLVITSFAHCVYYSLHLLKVYLKKKVEASEEQANM